MRKKIWEDYKARKYGMKKKKITLNETGEIRERRRKGEEIRGGFSYLYVWGYKETCLSS